MSYTARQAIIKAYYLSGLYSRRLETVDGGDVTFGLELLNDLLADNTVDSPLIPFYKEHTFDTEENVRVYYVEGLVEIATETFSSGQTRYGTQYLSRRNFFGTSRQENVSSLPFSWHSERALDGTNIYLYPLPSAVYTVTLWGRFALTEAATLDTDLSLIYERNYRNYMIYKLSQLICQQNQIPMPDGVEAELTKLEEKCTYTSPVDLTVTKISTLSSNSIVVDLPNPLWTGWLP